MRGVIFAILTSLAWGLAPIIYKLGLKTEVSTFFALMVHSFSAFLLASLFFFALGEPLKVGLRELVFISLGGIVAGFLAMFFYFEAVRHGKVSIVAPIASTSPLWSVLFAYALLGESLNLQKLVGVFLIVLGMTILSLSKQ
jgi:transporter family protein